MAQNFINVNFCVENNFCRAEIIFLEFLPCRNYNIKKIKNFKKVAVNMGVGRPKLEIPRQDKVTIRVSKFEREKISRVAKEKNLTITDAILQGIDLLEKNKPKLTRSEFNRLKGIQPVIKQKNSLGAIEGETIMFNKK